MNQNSDPIKPCAILWDESFLWGLTAFEALKSTSLPFDLIRSDDIKNHMLHKYAMLFIPGGWASNKIKTLGEDGVQEIRSFVEGGGNYLGFCGGAGLATLDGIGLLNINRVPTKDRVPSFSGRAKFSLRPHDIWNGISEPLFHVWWPSQFSLNDPALNVLSTYEDALPDSYSSDLNVGDVQKYCGDWKVLEKSYGINLDPARLYGQPALVEGRYGKGKVVLSLIHFDTPDDENGSVVLKNLWKYMSGFELQKLETTGAKTLKRGMHKPLEEMLTVVEDLISFGARNFLWFRRNRILLQWKRGIRGLEYCTLYAMIKATAEHAVDIRPEDSHFNSRLLDINIILRAFKEKADKLLLLERLAIQDGHRITYDKSDNPAIIELRTELFANSKSYGGMFKVLLDKIDDLVFQMLKSSME